MIMWARRRGEWRVGDDHDTKGACMNYIGVCKAEERGILGLHLDMGMGAGFACASHVVGKKISK